MNRQALRWLLGWFVVIGLLGCRPSPPAVSLQQAVQKGNLKAVQQHIAAGSDLNTKDRTGWTALHLAAMKGDLVIVKTLSEAGADRSIKGLGARTALDLARERNKPAVVQYLEAHAAKPGRGLVDGGLGVSGVLDSQ